MKLNRIFLIIFIAMGVLGVGGCKDEMPDALELPKEISSVSQPFIAALKRGDIAVPERYMGVDAREDAVEYYGPAKIALGKAPELRPVIIRYKPTPFGQPDKNDVTITYVAKKGAIWTSLNMRLFRLEGEQYEIEYWNVKQEPKQPQALAIGEKAKTWLMIAMLAVAVLAVLFLLFLIWFVRRKSHIVAPDINTDSRAVASTQQDSQ